MANYLYFKRSPWTYQSFLLAIFLLGTVYPTWMRPGVYLHILFPFFFLNIFYELYQNDEIALFLPESKQCKGEQRDFVTLVT